MEQFVLFHRFLFLFQLKLPQRCKTIQCETIPTIYYTVLDIYSARYVNLLICKRRRQPRNRNPPTPETSGGGCWISWKGECKEPPLCLYTSDEGDYVFVSANGRQERRHRETNCDAMRLLFKAILSACRLARLASTNFFLSSWLPSSCVVIQSANSVGAPFVSQGARSRCGELVNVGIGRSFISMSFGFC